MALSAASLQAAYAPGLTAMEKAKPWSVSASLRGFYDDNYTTTPSKSATGAPRDSLGFEVSPSASLNLPLQTSFIGLSYIYSMRYYDDRASDKADHSHQFNGKFDHAFSERYKLETSESFVIAQEPEILDPSGLTTVPLRTEGDNLRNTASADFTAQLSKLLGVQLGYENQFYDYEQTQADIINDPALNVGNPFGFQSRSSLLDRMEHMGTINLRWQAMPQTVAILGYQFGLVDYTSDDPIQPGVQPQIRNKKTHRWYVGADQNFNSKLNGSLRVGGELANYYNDPAAETGLGPYADGSLTYAYAQGDYLQAGLRHSRNQTDVFAPAGASVTQDQESTAFYVSLVHQLTAKISANVLGQFQHSIFEGGAFDDSGEQYFTAGLNLAYRINPHWLAETGYNYWRLASEIPDRSYSRNYLYLGVRATY